jgi:hypothetical protein
MNIFIRFYVLLKFYTINVKCEKVKLENQKLHATNIFGI